MQSTKNAFILAVGLIISTVSLGYFFEQAVTRYRAFDRTIQVKGLAEREMPADMAIWPIQYTVVGDDLTAVYAQLEAHSTQVKNFALQRGFEPTEIRLSQPMLTDKNAQNFANYQPSEVRYIATQTLTVHSSRIALIRQAQSHMLELGKLGVVLNGDPYTNSPQFIFSGLNQIKPQMIAEATTRAREMAIKFAADSDSQLGKIKRARQGQFSIRDRDSNTPYIKQVRVVATIEYYLID